MSKEHKSDILQCYRLAAEARRMANAASDRLERADLLAVEERWLSLACSPALWSGTRRKDARAS
jgi:hypothetical protein